MSDREITREEGDRLVVRYGSKLFLWLFWRPVLKVIRRLINRAKERGLINSIAFHELHAMADRVLKPKQKGAQ